MKKLKFLGMEYDGLTNTLKASTRKGATLPMTKWGLVEDVLMRQGDSSDSLKEYKDERT